MNKISAKVILPALFTLGAGTIGFMQTDTCKQMLIRQQQADMANAKAWKYEGCKTLEDSINVDAKWSDAYLFEVISGRSVPEWKDDYLLAKYHSRHIDALNNAIMPIKSAINTASEITGKYIDKKTTETKVWTYEKLQDPKTWGVLASLGLLGTGFAVYSGRKEEDTEAPKDIEQNNNKIEE